MSKTELKKNITTVDEALEYLENILKNWSNWKEHHTVLVQSLEIILAKIKGCSRK